jgi:hypothetical protein
MKLIVRIAWPLAFLLSITGYQAYAQSRQSTGLVLFVEGTSLTTAQKADFERRVKVALANRPERSELKDLRGEQVIRSGCPVGYVKNISYQFSKKEVIASGDKGVDCDSPKLCKAWEIKATPTTGTITYDVAIHLQCTDDDTVQRRDQSELASFLPAAILNRIKGVKP